jgi:hypothetical protein
MFNETLKTFMQAARENVDSSEHSQLVAEALRAFPGSCMSDPITESLFEQFRSLAREAYPNDDPLVRILKAFEALNEVIAVLENAASRARQIHRTMAVMYEQSLLVVEEVEL